ncbi:MAG: BamA/TamA family outer membrane protein [Deltaproteobacteria bacterium]|nr:BamA/TamA family outer membrane protein [Deltaproteobacteria bacterium]MBW2071480.1 BamA/TamA family outer membrane protein [Deltaproteobacteria bacterium]
MKRPVCALSFLLVLFISFSAYGQGVRLGPDGKVTQQTLSLPYAFYNESFGFALAYVYALVGYPQKQATMLTTFMAGSKGSAMGFLVGRDLKMPYLERLFLDPVVSVGYFQDAESYVNGKPRFAGQRAGSNDSDEDNFVKGDGWDNFFRMKFKYLLPIGNGKDEIISTYEIDRGLLTSEPTGGTSLNPLASGKTYLELRPFYRSQQLDGKHVDDKTKTSGLDIGFFWDNRDFYANPSQGLGLRGKLSRDFGLFDSSNSWTNLESELDVYIPLHLADWLRQTVLALDCWTSYSPTWDKQADGTVKNRPPAYTGPTLGGLWRMRGYPTQRFSDRSAIYYTAELRMIPHWNPFPGWPRVQKYVGIQWLQFVPFVEIGRVASRWSLSRLHSDMKWDVGLGMRAWAKGIVIRIDSAYSDENFGVQMMVSQPFQF